LNFTLFGLPLECYHFDNSIIADTVCTIDFLLFYINELNHAVFSSDEENIGVQHGCHNGTDHRTVSNGSLHEHSFNVTAHLILYDLPNTNSIVQATGYNFGLIAV
jgi:hypothetical protein